MLEFLGRQAGRTLDEAVVKRGLRELCPGLHFDLAGCLTSQTGIHPGIESRQGVYYEGRHITAMDRGWLPEFKQWSVAEQVVPIEWSQADEEGASIQFVAVAPDDPLYPDLRALAERGSDPTVMLWHGKVYRCRPMGVRKRPQSVIWVGWRHTFERLLAARLPGITRASLSAKFGVDMFAVPVGPPEEIHAALYAE